MIQINIVRPPGGIVADDITDDLLLTESAAQAKGNWFLDKNGTDWQPFSITIPANRNYEKGSIILVENSSFGDSKNYMITGVSYAASIQDAATMDAIITMQRVK